VESAQGKAIQVKAGEEAKSQIGHRAAVNVRTALDAFSVTLPVARWADGPADQG
jgi:hypothetical protein